MRTRLLALVCLLGSTVVAASCKGPEVNDSPDASLAGAAGDGSTDSGAGGASESSTGPGCNATKNEGPKSLGSCLFAPKFVDCTLDGSGAGCLSDGPDSCTGLEGASCVSKCASNQFAVACGGPPEDGVTYDPVPANCEIVARTPSGKAYACCTCDEAN